MRRPLEVVLVVVIFGALGLWILYAIVNGINDTAEQADKIAAKARVAAMHAEDAAAIAVLNNIRIEKAALAACRRATDGIDASNRNGAIIYLVLSRTARTPGRASPATRRSFRSLGRLPLFQARTDCDRAAADPEYKPPTPRPFAELPHWKVRQALRQGR